MRGIPYAKKYPGNRRKIWERFDALPQGIRKMLTEDNADITEESLLAMEELARELGLLPPLEVLIDRELTNKEKRALESKELAEKKRKASWALFRKSLPNDTSVIKLYFQPGIDIPDEGIVKIIEGKSERYKWN